MFYAYAAWKSRIIGVALLGAGLIANAVVAGPNPYTHPAGPNGETHTHELGVAITCASPPYYYLNGHDGGREWSLVADAFRQTGHPARALYFSLGDALDAFRNGWIDAVWVCGGTEIEIPEGWYWSKRLLPRRFAAATLADMHRPIESLADLAGSTVGVHPEVAAVLGDALKPLEGIDPPLQVIANHALLLLKLYRRRLDVVVVETSAFEYFRQKLPAAVQSGESVALHEIFSPLYPRLVFRDSMLRDAFDQAWTDRPDQDDADPVASSHSPDHASAQLQE
ncbi:MAG: hypothetical protein ACK2UQ_07805 [Anaerolineae bacterium]|jgi:hypothetical protein